jgi:hypothetical protein
VDSPFQKLPFRQRNPDKSRWGNVESFIILLFGVLVLSDSQMSPNVLETAVKKLVVTI